MSKKEEEKQIKKASVKGGHSGEEDMIACKTPKELKALARPQFQANPSKFYPTTIFNEFGYHRHQCPKCSGFYWRYSEEVELCGDSNCMGSYSFIGKGFNDQGKHTTYEDVYKTFAASLHKNGGTSHIDRYPVVARWRNDVDYVAAGIYCFQPYCVTGELEAPANPATEPQMCVRFNDLDNIGITGRHYSSFIMMGIHAFNYGEKDIFWKDDCVRCVQKWLTEDLKIPPIEITWREDIWAGGGNLGPCVQFFVRGLEVGNCVFMQYKTFPDGSREELPIRVIDTGIGQERVCWIMNGTPTSYVDTFGETFQLLVKEKLELNFDQGIWKKFSPYSCQLDIDQSEDIEKTWEKISELIGMSIQDVKAQIEPVKDAIIILDHTRTVMMIIEDGSLPSNVGGGSNVRNILRRVFAILQKHSWWDKIGGLQGLIQIFNSHKKDLAKLYGDFKDYPSFRPIIEEEIKRWRTTDEAQVKQLERILKKNKGTLSIDDWIIAIQSWGMAADKIAQASNLPIPNNLYYEMAERQDKVMKAVEAVLYSTSHLPETKNLYYADHHLYEFGAKVVAVFSNVLDNQKKNIVILDGSAFYPTSGGQMHDTGSMTINGEEYEVKNVEKVGHCVLHYVDRALDQALNAEGEDQTGEVYVGKEVDCRIDPKRRSQLRWHHTATHIVFASCRKILGPHVWQNGAKKTIGEAHLDITHYKGLTKQEEQAIENEANRIITSSHKINKFLAPKTEMEKKYGFSLYQGGIVPGKELRIVQIDGVDTEACCGTHCDSTAQVGWVRMIKSSRISDGIVRLYYVAGERAIEVMNHEQDILHNIEKIWSVDQGQLVSTAQRFLDDYKRLNNQTKRQEQKILNLQMNFCTSQGPNITSVVKSDESNPTLYFSFLPTFAPLLVEKKQGIVFIGSQFVIGLLTNPESFSVAQTVQEVLKLSLKKEDEGSLKKQIKDKVASKKPGEKKATNVSNVSFFLFTLKTQVNVEEVATLLKDKHGLCLID